MGRGAPGAGVPDLCHHSNNKKHAIKGYGKVMDKRNMVNMFTIIVTWETNCSNPPPLSANFVALDLLHLPNFLLTMDRIKLLELITYGVIFFSFTGQSCFPELEKSLPYEPPNTF